MDAKDIWDNKMENVKEMWKTMEDRVRRSHILVYKELVEEEVVLER